MLPGFGKWDTKNVARVWQAGRDQFEAPREKPIHRRAPLRGGSFVTTRFLFGINESMHANVGVCAQRGDGGEGGVGGERWRDAREIR